MQTTVEQQAQMMDEDRRHNRRTGKALNGIRGIIGDVCGQCWYRNSPQGCRGRECAVHRVFAELYRCERLLGRGKLTANWWKDAKEATEWAAVPYIGNNENN